MTEKLKRYEGGDLVVQSLQSLGVKQMFSVSGGILNSIYHAANVHGLPLIHNRHEAGSAFMAEGVSRISGVPGVTLVTLGPGVSNTVTSALVAKMAGTPMLIIGAQCPTSAFDKGAGMSVDPMPFMAPVTKWAARVLHTERIPEYIESAWRIMWSGRPGPVFLEIPVDVLSAAAKPMKFPTYQHRFPGLDSKSKVAMLDAVKKAKRPLLVLGDDVRWDLPEALTETVEKLHFPFVNTRLARGVVDENHPLCAGVGYNPPNGALRNAMGEADLVFIMGHHLEFDLTFGKFISDDATIVQCSIEAEIVGKSRRSDVPMIASPSSVVDALQKVTADNVDRSWVDAFTQSWRSEHETQAGDNPNEAPIHPLAAVDAVTAVMPDDTMYVTSHGNVDFWADARLKFKKPLCYLRPGQAGCLGAEIPYAIGARFADPTRPAVVFVGDGSVGFHIMEMDTAERYDRPIIVVVLDDQKWAAIALPQCDDYGDEFEMGLPERDWPALARSIGGFGIRAETVNEIGPAIEEAVKSGKPSIVHVPIRSVLSPYMANF